MSYTLDLASGQAVAQPLAFNGRQDPVSGPVVGALDTDGLTQCVAQCVTTGTGRGYDPGSETLALIPVRADQGGSQMSVSYDVAPTLRAQEHGHQPLIPVAFQPGNISRRAGAEPSEKVFPTLGATTQGDQFPHVAIGFNGDQSEKTRSVGEAEEQCPTLRAGGTTHVAHTVAFTQNQRDEVRDLGDTAGALAAEPGMKQSIAPTLPSRERGGGGLGTDFDLITEVQNDGNANQADPREILRNLRNKIGAKAFSEWGFGVFASLQQTEILQSEVHGGRVQKQTEKGKPSMDDVTLSCEEFGSAGAMLSVRERECQRCSPQGRELEEQRTGELGKDLPELSQLKAQAEEILHRMWETGQGARILRETLAEIQEVRRSDDVKSQPVSTRYAVRRLTPLETERLQGLPDGWTNIPGASDTARYKAIGNSIAIPVVSWIMKRIYEVFKTEQ